MFRLLYFEISGHPKLGHIRLDFTGDLTDDENPYTTLIIGMNGTGKSLILKTIADLFYEVDRVVTGQSRDRIPFRFHLRYVLASNIYDIISNKLFTVDHKSLPLQNVAGIFALKNRPRTEDIFQEGFTLGPLKKYQIDIRKLQIPSKVIVSTTQLNDRFTFRKDEDSDVYKYSGVRRTAQSISTKAFQRNIADALFAATKHRNLSSLLETTLVDYLDFQKHLQIHYKTKYSQFFYNSDLNAKSFDNFYRNWKNTTRRSSQPWGTWKYDQIISSNPKRIDEIISFIKDIRENNLLFQRRNSDSKKFIVDFFNLDQGYWDPSLINDLIQLDILMIDRIEVRKGQTDLNLSETSAGENQIVMSLLSILAKIETNSLVLIDEPEISLHPNWQMKYIHLLKQMFRSFSDCHFLIATHSHFLVSDIKPNSSSLITLTPNNDKSSVLVESLTNTNTYGWSTEEILYKVFGVRTTRNYYLELDLRELLYLISNNSQNKNAIQTIMNRVREVELGPNDPLNLVIKQVEEYLEK